MIRVFAVDDSPFVRKALKKVLAATPDLRLVGEAAGGRDALARIVELDPHVVTLDIQLADMNGLEVLRRLLAMRPRQKVIMLSAHTREGAEATLEALQLGAADCVDKATINVMDLERLGRELNDRIRSLAAPGSRRAAEGRPRNVPRVPELARMELCVIGASTGGPAVLQMILERLPAEFPLPVAVVQHMPPGFTRPFANRLNGLCRLAVSEAVAGSRLEPGQVIIAPAGQHLRLSKDLVVALSVEPDGHRHIPSVDVLFHSALAARPGRVLGVLLTGMGEDGADGLTAIRQDGGVTVVESEATCAVYGMPRAAVARGAAQHVLPNGAIADLLGGMTRKVASLSPPP